MGGKTFYLKSEKSGFGRHPGIKPWWWRFLGVLGKMVFFFSFLWVKMEELGEELQNPSSNLLGVVLRGSVSVLGWLYLPIFSYKNDFLTEQPCSLEFIPNASKTVDCVRVSRGSYQMNSAIYVWWKFEKIFLNKNSITELVIFQK